MGENMEKEQWMKESLQMQKVSWIQDEITKRREREDELLQQIFMEQKMLQELDEDMDENGTCQRRPQIPGGHEGAGQ